jgi:Flp pilus assembly pilin Flp
MKKDCQGQNLIEYAIVVAIVASAMIAMSTYVYRSIQAAQQAIQEEYR